jgi:glyoxylase-like metal-dependent hydrolase (beta-lactamase superfamily II)
MLSDPVLLPSAPSSSTGTHLPRLVLPTKGGGLPAIYAFPPNRDTLGGTAYLLILPVGNLLVDCPAWNDQTQAFLQHQGGVSWLFLTHRGAIGQVRAFQETFNCPVICQEQEAYLLPGLTVTPFQQEFLFSPECRALWTPGHSPGSACLYYQGLGGVLFSGRHLLADPQGILRPLQTAKTFHWRRQLASVERLIQAFTPETLQFVCPGANIGFLRGQLAIADAYEKLTQCQQEFLFQP